MKYQIEQEILTDGSMAYNLIIVDDDGQRIKLHCQSERAAYRLIDALEGNTVDF